MSILLFDGDCRFCRFYVEKSKLQSSSFLEKEDEPIEFESYQEAVTNGKVPKEHKEKLSLEILEKKVHYINSNGIYTGAQAILRLEKDIGTIAGTIGTFFYENFSIFRSISESIYNFVASHRSFFSRLIWLFFGNDLKPYTYNRSSRFFLFLLSFCLLIAFASIGTQAPGLFGPKGILPGRYSDFQLNFLSIIGSIFALLISFLVSFDSFRILTGILLFICWLFYLLICGAAQEFMWFQWDSLLLEMTLAGLFLHLFRNSYARALVYLLCFKVLFFSGFVKLESGDPNWKNLTALSFHYLTQPLPNPLSYFFNRLPDWFHKLSCIFTFATELIIPFFIFLPGRAKIIAAFFGIALQALINLTGNYGFFGLQNIALMMFLLDDRFFSWFDLKRKLSFRIFTKKVLSVAQKQLITTILSLGILFLYIYIQVFPYSFSAQALAPLRSVNTYGLFAVMTTTRDEVIIEGSDDGQFWRPYLFKYKPSTSDDIPPFIPFHMPRLDWQMWFASLIGPQGWFENLMQELLKGPSQQIKDLFSYVPFDKNPPKFIRARIAQFEFTDASASLRSNHWWKISKERMFFGPTNLKPNK
ncbi:MAG: lipase maturation factor family protein [Bacteriovoracia bacterium]